MHVHSQTCTYRHTHVCARAETGRPGTSESKAERANRENSDESPSVARGPDGDSGDVGGWIPGLSGGVTLRL